MSDISLDFGPVGIILVAIVIGWPALLMGVVGGGVLGALFWRFRRFPRLFRGPVGAPIVGMILGLVAGVPGAFAWVNWMVA